MSIYLNTLPMLIILKKLFTMNFFNLISSSTCISPLSAKKSVDMSEIEKWDNEISTLKAKLESAKVVVPSGSRSIDERFSY